MLQVTVDKYRTATGTVEALRVLQFIDSTKAELVIADVIADEMAVETERMRKKAEKLTYEEMDELCDGFYDKEYVVKNNLSLRDQVEDLAFEMMRIDLCRNVGGAAEDMVEFVKRVDGEIEKVEAELKELLKADTKCDECSVGCNAGIADCKNFTKKED
jgi:hypothetical protein